MRIIAGLYRGRILKTLRGLEVRPTSDRLRETLFDILGPRVEGCVFIDAYAGTGAIGLEALSRGARRVILIEEDAAAARLIQDNAESLGVAENVDILRAPASQGLRLLKLRGVVGNFCFLDPPYTAPGEYDRALRILGRTNLLAPGGLVILQHSRKHALEERIGPWHRVRLVNQGSNALSFYRRASAA